MPRWAHLSAGTMAEAVSEVQNQLVSGCGIVSGHCAAVASVGIGSVFSSCRG
jgi:hypothetical protein